MSQRLEDRKIKSGLKTSPHSNNKTMNNSYNIKDTPNVSEASSFEDRTNKSGLKHHRIVRTKL